MLEGDKDFAGKKVLVTAGPTYEKIDPVRFIGNYSSGKMGFALAAEFASRGAEVTLIAGPVSLPTPVGNIRRVDVESAGQMYTAAIEAFPAMDMAVLSAAVADFTPEAAGDRKLKRQEGLSLGLRPTQDIAAALGVMKRNDQMLVGFALETHDEKEHAREKLRRKNLDMIVLNSLGDAGAGFSCDTNKVTLLKADGSEKVYPLKSKRDVARDIADNMVL